MNLNKDEKITEHNMHLLKAGDIIFETPHGLKYIFVSHICKLWFNAKSLWDSGHITRVDKHSFRDAGIVPNNYNDHESFYRGNIYDNLGCDKYRDDRIICKHCSENG